MQTFRELGVNIKGLKNSKGSGCIVKVEDKFYVLTAQHCLTEDKYKRNFTPAEISSVQIYNDSKEQLDVKNIYVPSSIEDDFAVIEVNSSSQYPNVSIRYPDDHMEYTFFGYPYYLENDYIQGDSLNGSVSEVIDSKLLLQHHSGSLSDVDNDAKDNTKGYSGSGIYTECNGQYYLIGILVSLRANGEHGKLLGINIKYISDFFKKMGIPEMLPNELIDFEYYFSKMLADENEEFGKFLRRMYRDNLSGLGPSYLKSILNEKISLPYNPKNDILNDTIWIGWVKLLLYISVYKNERISKDNLDKHIYINPESDSKNILYYTQARLESFIRILYQESFDDICNDALVFVNSEKILKNKVIEPKRVNEILVIDNPLYEQGIDISNPNQMKNITVVPFSYIVMELEDVIENCLVKKAPLEELGAQCIEKIRGIFSKLNSINLLNEKSEGGIKSEVL
ncbi:hypothetical protein CON22_24975 [Bacillus cereus]|nr:hypothetical protein CON22_24975 [Bacillus cereus]